MTTAQTPVPRAARFVRRYALGPCWVLTLALGCTSSSPPPSSSTSLDPDTVRFLEQSTFGPTEPLAAQVKAQGFSAFLDQQFAAPVSSLGTYPVVLQGPAQVCPTGSAPGCYRDNFTAFPPAVQFFHNALSGEDQLRQRMAFALGQILVVSGDEVRTTYGIADYQQLLLANAFGNFRQILEAVTLSPAMGRYLNMVNNDKPNPAAGTNPNENYARELLQLFSIGLVQLRGDGTVVTDSGGQPVPTYDQGVVEGFAHVFTGWTYPTLAGATLRTHNPVYYRGPMEVVASNHDTAAKALLGGTMLPAGQTPAKDLADALDLIFQHPNVGPFIGRQLIQFLVTSNPSPAYVSRVSAAFADNGSGIRGDMQAVARAILLDPEARGASNTDPDFGKLREPALLLAGLARALGVQSDGVFLRNASAALGQDVFQAPSVFNFYPPNAPLPGTSLVSPPSTLLDATTAMTRSNAIYAILFRNIAADATVAGSTGTSAPLTDLANSAADPAALVDQLDALLLHKTMSGPMRTAVLNAVNAVPASDAVGRVRAAAYVIGTSAQYQVER
jgi:uncharacterized protein (DUF1800 family)